MTQKPVEKPEGHVSLTPDEIKRLVKDKGWKMVDVAARWGLSQTWLSLLTNNPSKRLPHFDDAFRGLPLREDSVVNRSARYIRKRPKKANEPSQRYEHFPTKTVLSALSNRYVEEGSQWVVIKTTYSLITQKTDIPLITIKALDVTDGQEITFPENLIIEDFQDIGLTDSI